MIVSLTGLVILAKSLQHQGGMVQVLALLLGYDDTPTTWILLLFRVVLKRHVFLICDTLSL